MAAFSGPQAGGADAAELTPEDAVRARITPLPLAAGRLSRLRGVRIAEPDVVNSSLARGAQNLRDTYSVVIETS